MKRRLWLIFAVLVLIASAVWFRLPPDTLTQAAPAVDRLPDVRVQHEFVTVPTSPAGSTSNPQERTRLARTRAAPDSSSATATIDAQTAEAVTRKATTSRASRDQTLFEKARRAFMGDGRHRPEPFPRPRGNN